ncbi:hypothetical protein LTSEINV_1462, partial [Salmonella enterica subsp. enterica serovar Inverness str. R8-3668]
MLADIAAGAENQNALRHVALLSGLKRRANRRGVNQDIP